MKNFETLENGGAVTLDMANLSVNNTITGLILDGGLQTVNNVTTAAAGNVQITAGGTPTISVLNATNPGNIDTVSINVSDNSSTVATIAIVTPVLAGIENLKLTATDNITISALTSATALTSITSSGAGTLAITSGTVAANSNETIDASAETGTVAIDVSAATANGWKITGSATNADTLTGGVKADQLIGGSAADTLANEAAGTTASAGDILTGGAGTTPSRCVATRPRQRPTLPRRTSPTSASARRRRPPAWRRAPSISCSSAQRPATTRPAVLAASPRVSRLVRPVLPRSKASLRTRRRRAMSPVPT